MAHSRKRRKKSDEGIRTGEPRRRPRRALRRLIVLLLLLAAIVAAAPMIVASTTLRNVLLASAMPAAGWRVESRDAALAWTGQQSLSDVTIVDRAGKPLLTAEKVSLGRSLLSLAANRSKLGKLTIFRPVVHLETRSDGSNVEDLLAALQEGMSIEDDTDTLVENSSPTITVEIVDGVVQGFDESTQQQWLVDKANLVVEVGQSRPGSVALDGELGVGGTSGRMKFRLQEVSQNQQQLDILTDNLPLAPLESWLLRVAPGTRLRGAASWTAQIRWSRDPQSGLVVQTNGNLEVADFGLMADALSGDQLHSNYLKVPWEVSVAGDQVTIGKLQIDADWARFEATGSITFEELSALSVRNLPKRKSHIVGSVQLDQLAAMLPQTLQLREGVRIDSGELTFQADGQQRAEGFAWSAISTVKNVVGSDGRRNIQWEQPIEAEVELVETPLGPQVKQFSLSAPFATASIQTAANNVDGTFRVDLEELSQELGQFVDLGDWQFQGAGEGSLTLNRKEGNQFEASAGVQLTDLDISQGSRPVWVEPQLQVELGVEGQAVEFTPQVLTSGTIQLHGPRDRFDIELLQPVDLSRDAHTWSLQLRGNGPLASWAGRLRPWTAVVPEEISGKAEVSAKVRLAPEAVHLVESDVSFADLQVRSGVVAIDEPRVQFSGDCRWEAGNNSLVSREMQLVSSTLAFRSRDVEVELGAESIPTTSGAVAFRADLERLAAAGGIVGQQSSTWPRGATTGNLQLSSNAQELRADFSATADQLFLVRTSPGSGAAGGRPEIVWTEPKLNASGKAVYTIADDRLRLENLQLDGQTVKVEGSASLDKLGSEGLLEAGGIMQYEQAALDQLLASYLGPEVRLQGDRQVRFQVRGKLASSDTPLHWSRRWNLSTDAGWSTASLYGLPLSAGRLQARLGDGQLYVAPLDIGVGQGRLTANPLAVFDPSPQRLMLPQGPLITNVQFSPQVSESMLKYVAPIVAGATRAEGEFSVELGDTQIPLDDPKQSRVVGRLDVHRLRVAPGPILADFIRLVEQIDTLTMGGPIFQAAAASEKDNALTISERQIEFQVAEGRVYHRNLEFEVDNVPVRSYGSVGFDQTLALVMEIPIQQKWVERQRALRSLAGQSIRIPISGTFAKPRIDERAVTDLSRQLLQGAATEAIGGELNRALDKLFKSR